MADIRWIPTPRANFDDAIALTKLAYDTGNNTVTGLVNTANQFMQNAQTNNLNKAQVLIDSMPISELQSNREILLNSINKQLATDDGFAGIDTAKLNDYINRRPAVLQQQQLDNNKVLLDNLYTEIKSKEGDDKLSQFTIDDVAKKSAYANSIRTIDPAGYTQLMNEVTTDIAKLNGTDKYNLGQTQIGLATEGLTNTNKLDNQEGIKTKYTIDKFQPVFNKLAETDIKYKTKLQNPNLSKEDRAKLQKEYSTFQAGYRKLISDNNISSIALGGLQQGYDTYALDRKNAQLTQEKTQASIDNLAANTKQTTQLTPIKVAQGNAQIGFVTAQTKDIPLARKQAGEQIDISRQNADTATYNAMHSSSGRGSGKGSGGDGNIRKQWKEFEFDPLTEDDNGNKVVDPVALNSYIRNMIEVDSKANNNTMTYAQAKAQAQKLPAGTAGNYIFGDTAWQKLDAKLATLQVPDELTGVKRNATDNEKSIIMQGLGSDGVRLNEFLSLDSSDQDIINYLQNQRNASTEANTKTTQDKIGRILNNVSMDVKGSSAAIAMALGWDKDPEIFKRLPENVRAGILKEQSRRAIDEADRTNRIGASSDMVDGTLNWDKYRMRDSKGNITKEDKKLINAIKKLADKERRENKIKQAKEVKQKKEVKYNIPPLLQRR